MRLTVRVIQARNLPAWNSNGRYVKLQLGKQRFVTKAIKMNLNPTWDQKFSFLVGDVKDVLKLDVYDENILMFDHFRGQLMVPMLDVLAADDLSLGTRWYQLLPENRGEICVSISVFPETPFSELLKSLESRHEGVEMPVNLQGILVNESYLASPSDLNNLLFSPDSDFKQAMVERQGCTGFKTEPWWLDNDGESLKRVVTYTTAPSKLEDIRATEEQSYLKADGKEYAVLLSVSTPDVPGGTYYRTEILFRIIPGPELDSQQQTSHLVVSWRMNFLQSTFMESMIEYRVRQGLEQNYAQFSDLLSQKIKPNVVTEWKPSNSSEQGGLGMPPIPPSQNQFSARGRMGVHSRYVDTFNKSGASGAIVGHAARGTTARHAGLPSGAGMARWPSISGAMPSYNKPATPTVTPPAAAKFFMPTAAPAAADQMMPHQATEIHSETIHQDERSASPPAETSFSSTPPPTQFSSPPPHIQFSSPMQSTIHQHFSVQI